MAVEPQHQRVILHLRHGAAERAMIHAAAELAHMLGLALHGFFLEDAALTDLAALPFVREFRLGTGAWQKLDRGQLVEEQRAAAVEAQRLLNEAADALGVVRLFEVVSGDPALLLAATSHAGDIIVVAQPRLPAERLVHATAEWLEAAHNCGASVMLVPPVPARGHGPIAAVACDASDPALPIAAHIAAAAGESLLLLVPGSPQIAKQAAAAGACRWPAAAADHRAQHRRHDARGRRAGAWRCERAAGGAGTRHLRQG